MSEQAIKEAIYNAILKFLIKKYDDYYHVIDPFSYNYKHNNYNVFWIDFYDKWYNMDDIKKQGFDISEAEIAIRFEIIASKIRVDIRKNYNSHRHKSINGLSICDPSLLDLSIYDPSLLGKLNNIVIQYITIK